MPQYMTMLGKLSGGKVLRGFASIALHLLLFLSQRAMQRSTGVRLQAAGSASN
jgi:hypothetical protein